jgi:hypothetical protein
MKLKYILLTLFLILISILFIFNYKYRTQKELENKTPIKVGELLKNPTYDELVKIYGRVSYLGEINQFRKVRDCPCFVLYSGDGAVNIWYDSMKILGPIERFSVDVSQIKNGQWVVVTGELRSESKDREFKDFWAKKIEK